VFKTYQTLPGLESAVLQSTSVRERDVPRAGGLHDIHRVQVEGGLFFGLTARQELRMVTYVNRLLANDTYTELRTIMPGTAEGTVR
jgi:hypothetical protein